MRRGERVVRPVFANVTPNYTLPNCQTTKLPFPRPKRTTSSREINVNSERERPPFIKSLSSSPAPNLFTSSNSFLKITTASHCLAFPSASRYHRLSLVFRHFFSTANDFKRTFIFTLDAIKNSQGRVQISPLVLPVSCGTRESTTYGVRLSWIMTWLAQSTRKTFANSPSAFSVFSFSCQTLSLAND